MNVLTDEVFTVRLGAEETTLSLSTLLARLLTGPDVDAFPGLAADQRGYWWRFLVRCGARALRTAGWTVEQVAGMSGADVGAGIEMALLEHTDTGDWELHQADPARPGFLQPPTFGGGLPEDGYREETTALLTAILGTKGHERKADVARELDAEATAFALIEYQSGVVFGGRGNYESQLMGSRSGAGSGTPFVGAWIDRSYVRTFHHDVTVLLDRWDTVHDDLGLQGDVWALWTVPWDGEHALPATTLDPAFIPTARLVRLGPPRDGLYHRVWFQNSGGSRVADHTDGGHLGDPFTPLIPDPKKGHLKVRGTLEKGYDYVEVVRLLFPQDRDDAVRAPSVDAAFRSPPLADVELDVILEGTAFEQGKTRGYHRRVVRLPRGPVRTGLLGHRFEPIHQAHGLMLERTGQAKRVLRSALAIILTGEPRARDDDRRKLATHMNHFEEAVDRVYLEELFAAAARLQAGESDWLRPYTEWLFRTVVDDLFPRGLRALPRSTGRQMEEEVRAGWYLRGRLKRDLELDKTPSGEEAA